MKIALLADIHGNLPALEAVLLELERRQPDVVVVNGDLINAVPFSRDVVDLIRRRPDWVVVRGNHEFYYLDFGSGRAAPGWGNLDRWGQLHWLVRELQPAHAHYLGSLPDDRTLYFPGAQPIRMTHGTPGKNRNTIYRQMSDEKAAAELQLVGEQTLFTAHSHIPVDRHVVLMEESEGGPHGAIPAVVAPVKRQWHVINPGSVGLPLDGRPTAQFAMVTRVSEHECPGGWAVEPVSIPYDRRPALEAYSTTGMLEAGGVITHMFYWELVTAEPEIVRFYRWSADAGCNPDTHSITEIFDRYVAATGRDRYVAARDPLRLGTR